jgi:hypothetical protein
MRRILSAPFGLACAPMTPCLSAADSSIFGGVVLLILAGKARYQECEKSIYQGFCITLVQGKKPTSTNAESVPPSHNNAFLYTGQQQGWGDAKYQLEGKLKLVFSSNAHKIARIWFVQQLVLLSFFCSLGRGHTNHLKYSWPVNPLELP